MAYEGWLSVGGVPIVNNALTYLLLQRGDCPSDLFRQPPCMTTLAVDGLSPEFVTVADAPWFDGSQEDLSSRFFGAYVWEVRGLSDTNRQTQIAEGIDDGADIGATRRTSRQVRVTASLFAQGRDALDYGVTWLSAALDGNRCGQHGLGCGTTDLEFLTDCPPPEDDDEETEEDYAETLLPYRRFLHEVATTSGPLERRLSNRREWWVMDVEWTFTAGRAWVFSATRPVDLPVTPSTVVSDVPYNLAPFPSAELPGDPVLVATNYAPNPSVESNSTGWFGVMENISGAQASVTYARVEGEEVAVGIASWRGQLTITDDGSGSAFMVLYHRVPLPTLPDDSRFSVTLWAALDIVSGSPPIGPVLIDAQWAIVPGTTVRTDALGSVPHEGGFASGVSILPPAGATTVDVRARFTIPVWTTGDVVRLYADACAVTNP